MSLSWTSLQTWEECHQKDFRRRQGQRLPTMDSRNFFPGTVADRTMRFWLENGAPPGGMPRIVRAMFDREETTAREEGDGVPKWRGPNDREVSINFVTELVRRLEPMLQELVLPFDYAPEWRFRHTILIPSLTGEPRPVDLVGGMDILVRENDPLDYDIWDLKATANKDYARKVRGQLIFYSLCVELILGRPARRVGILQPMVEGAPLVDFEITDDERRSVMSRMIAMAHGRWRGDHEVAETRGPCGWCDVKHACPRFMTLEQQMEAGRTVVELAE